jgi:hypothetical protein
VGAHYGLGRGSFGGVAPLASLGEEPPADRAGDLPRELRGVPRHRQGAVEETRSHFYELFKRNKMPLVNMKPSREYIKVRVEFGGSLMPAFRQTLTDSEIDTLIDYIAAK